MFRRRGPVIEHQLVSLDDLFGVPQSTEELLNLNLTDLRESLDLAHRQLSQAEGNLMLALEFAAADGMDVNAQRLERIREMIIGLNGSIELSEMQLNLIVDLLPEADSTTTE